MTVMIGIDRDGTLIDDSEEAGRAFPGCTEEWKEKISWLPSVAEGIHTLNSLPDTHCFIITNQGGVALTNERFKQLTEERAEEVTQFCIDCLEKQGAHIDKAFSCYAIDALSAEKYRAKGWTIDERYSDDADPDLKPNPGMLLKACAFLHKKQEECTIYMIGDRVTDVQTGINAGGQGILIPSPKTHERGDLIKTQEYAQRYPGRVHIVPSFKEAGELIRTQLKN